MKRMIVRNEWISRDSPGLGGQMEEAAEFAGTARGFEGGSGTDDRWDQG
jgi:hypothetical protein